MSRPESWTIYQVLEEAVSCLLCHGYPLLASRLIRARESITNYALMDDTEEVRAVIIDESKFRRFLYPLIALVVGVFVAMFLPNPFKADPATYRVILMDSSFPPRAIVQWTTEERPAADGCFLTWEDAQGREVRVSGTVITERLPVAVAAAPPPAQPAAQPAQPAAASDTSEEPADE